MRVSPVILVESGEKAAFAGKYPLLLSFLVIVFYSPILFSFQFSFMTGYDSIAMDLPWYNYLASSLDKGQLPLWDPYVAGGRSFIGESATGGFSPLRWASVLALSKNGVVSPRSMHVVFVFLHVLAAVLMFALVRHLGLSRFAALFSGFTFSVAGFAGRAGWFDMVESLVWLPLIFLFQIKALQERSLRRQISWALFAGLSLGMTVLAGRVHIAIMDALLVIAASVFFAFPTAKIAEDSSQRKNRLRAAALVLVIIGIASFAAAAIQLLPSMEYAREVKRWIGAPDALPATATIPYAYMNDGYSPRALFAFLFPFVDVGPTEGFTPYFGILPFLLALIGAWQHRENLWVRFLAGTAVVAFFFSMGGLSYLHRLAYFVVPFLWFAREAHRFLYLAHFAGAVLAGFGIAALFSNAREQAAFAGFMKVLRWCVIGSTAVIGVLVILRRPEVNDWIALSLLFLIAGYVLLVAVERGRRGAAMLFLLTAVTFCDIGAFSWNMRNVIEDRASGTDHLERLKSIRAAVSFLKTQPGLFRVHVDGDYPPNVGDVYQIQATASGMAATTLKSYDRLVHQCGRLDLMNVRYRLRASSEPGQAVFEANGWKVVQQPSGYPRAWLVHRTLVRASEEEVYQDVCSGTSDLRRTAVLSFPLEAGLDEGVAGDSDLVTVRAYEARRIEVETKAAGRAMLVLSENFFPGWVAEVNSIPAPIHKVNGGLRGIVVPEGTSRVVLRYAPRSVALGAALTLAAFLAALLVGLGLRKQVSSTNLP